MLKIVENLLGGRGSARTSLGDLRAPPDLLAGGEGLLPSPQEPTPTLGLPPFGPLMKNPELALVGLHSFFFAGLYTLYQILLEVQFLDQ